MKKIKIITTIMIAIILLLQIMSTVCMAESKTIETDNYKTSIEGYSQAENKAKGIVTVLRTIGIAVAIIGILVLGIKYMAGSVEARADYKKSMIPYLIGCIMLFAITTLLSIIYDLTSALNEAV